MKLTQSQFEAMDQIADENGCATETAAGITPLIIGLLLAKGMVRPVVAWQLTQKGVESMSAFKIAFIKRKSGRRNK